MVAAPDRRSPAYQNAVVRPGCWRQVVEDLLGLCRSPRARPTATRRRSRSPRSARCPSTCRPRGCRRTTGGRARGRRRSRCPGSGRRRTASTSAGSGSRARSRRRRCRRCHRPPTNGYGPKVSDSQPMISGWRSNDCWHAVADGPGTAGDDGRATIQVFWFGWAARRARRRRRPSRRAALPSSSKPVETVAGRHDDIVDDHAAALDEAVARVGDRNLDLSRRAACRGARRSRSPSRRSRR